MIKKYTLLLLLFTILVSFAQEKTELKWWNPANNTTSVIAGNGWPKAGASIYHRLPSKAEKKVRNAVWNLSKHAAGLSIRFWSNAPTIHVKYKLKRPTAMPHMPATGVSGLDLYGKTSNGEWIRNWGTYSINETSTYSFVMDGESNFHKKHGREYQLFLPLYNEVESLEIGIDSDSFLDPLPIRQEKPIVAYGTSICQGACASRPGMAWTNILERKIERPVINLGFSGNGRLEPELIDLMSEIDAKIYILDCLPNLSPKKHDTQLLLVNAVKKLREKRPNTPIILTAHIGYANSFSNKERRDIPIALNTAMQLAYHQLKAEGYTSIFMLQKEDINLNFDSFVDYIHPNDLGMMQYADAYEKIIREILDEPIGNLATTVPKTQSRDIAVYKWEDRHQNILNTNKTNPPKICFFGNSIVHFWGGQVNDPLFNGQDSWTNILQPLGIRNFGFGWDKIENMLWRIQHDELDGFEAAQIIVMAGTNNLDSDTENDIIQGIKNLIQAIKRRQPNSSLTLIGILPRAGKEQQIKTINQKTAKIAAIEGVLFKDIGTSLLLENGEINKDLFLDGLHPNGKGYTRIAKNIAEIVMIN